MQRHCSATSPLTPLGERPAEVHSESPAEAVSGASLPPRREEPTALLTAPEGFQQGGAVVLRSTGGPEARPQGATPLLRDEPADASAGKPRRGVQRVDCEDPPPCSRPVSQQGGVVVLRSTGCPEARFVGCKNSLFKPQIIFQPYPDMPTSKH